MFKDIFLLHNGLYIKNSTSYKLPSSEQEDEACRRQLALDMGSGVGLHALLDPHEAYKGVIPNNPVDRQPRIWKEVLTEKHCQTYAFNPEQAKYQEVLYEIIMTEQSYLDDMIMIHEIFIKEAFEWGGLLFSIEKLFKSIRDIINFHFLLLVSLRRQQFCTHPVVTSVTDIYIENLEGFKVYFAYFREFEKANTLLQRSIRRKDDLGCYILRRSSWPECKNLPFSAYLLKPIQRMMKYPLFFKSLNDCLLPGDQEIPRIQYFMEEIEKLLRCFDKEKREAEDFMKLEDLACRIKGLEGSTIHIAEPNRKLIYEGYLTIIPPSTQTSASFSKLNTSTISLASNGDTPKLSRRNSTFYVASKKKERAYVFLFNDLIVCTRERNRKKPPALDERGVEIALKKGTYYGPSPNALFEILYAPGRVTMVDQYVPFELPAPPTGKLPRKGSAFFQPFKRHGSRLFTEEIVILEDPLNSLPRQESFFSTKQGSLLDGHPLQFMCSIVTKSIINIQFEAETQEEKTMWCNHFEETVQHHVRRESQLSLPDIVKTPASSSSEPSLPCEETEFSVVSAPSTEAPMEVDTEPHSPPQVHSSPQQYMSPQLQQLQIQPLPEVYMPQHQQPCPSPQAHIPPQDRMSNQICVLPQSCSLPQSCPSPQIHVSPKICTSPQIVDCDPIIYKHPHSENLPTLINRLSLFNTSDGFLDSLLDDYQNQTWPQ
ncbi:hypothetical protein BY458DRAFT_516784 [Sporodiniella umbellata]|nr:hypothetical protein BY458DRAFT_516784 [Sporodiniella umbellata]